MGMVAYLANRDDKGWARIVSGIALGFGILSTLAILTAFLLSNFK